MRSGIYISLVVFGFLFLHYKNVNSDFEARQDTNVRTQAISATLTNEPANLLTVKGDGESTIAPVETTGTLGTTGANVFQPRPALLTTNDVIIVKGNNISAARTIPEPSAVVPANTSKT